MKTPPMIPPARSRAFSLTELLVTISILAMLLTLGGSAFEQLAQGSGVNKATSLTAGLVEQARSSAVLHGAGSRIVIDADPTSEGYLRRAGVLLAEKQEDGSVDWRFSSRPLLLPKGAYLYEDYSNPTGTMNVDFPGANAVCHYYEFDRQGRLVANGSGELVQIVFVAGVMADGPAGQLTIPSDRELGRQGLILRPAGNVTYFETPDQIRKP